MNYTFEKHPRLDSIDIMRAVAIIFMVICHSTIYLTHYQADYKWLYFFANHILGDFAAPFFLFLVGASCVLSSSHISPERYFKRSLLRGIIILLCGLILSVVLHGFRQLFEWDILTFIGIALILLLPCRNFSVRTLLLLCMLIFLVTPLLRSYVDYLASWGGKFIFSYPGSSTLLHSIVIDPAAEYLPGLGIIATIKGLFLVGYFPIFPWIIFPLVGQIVGRIISHKKIAHAYLYLELIGWSLVGFGIILAISCSLLRKISASSHFTVFSFYPDSSSLLLLQLGVVLVVFTFLWKKYDYQK